MVEKKRISVTMTLNQVESMDRLVRQGIYLDRGSFIIECIRKGLREYGLLKIKEAQT